MEGFNLIVVERADEAAGVGLGGARFLLARARAATLIL